MLIYSNFEKVQETMLNIIKILQYQNNIIINYFLFFIKN